MPLLSKTRIRLLIALTAAIALIATGLWLGMNTHTAPALARKLPEAEGYLYLDLRPVRVVLTAKGATLPAIQRDAEYEAFVKETGFEFERDLEQAAIAIHNYEPAPGENGKVELQRRYSEFFAGKFDAPKLTEWLRKHSQTTEKYSDVDIYNIAYEGRTVRVALLDANMVAVSNTSSSAPMHSMIDAAAKSSFTLEGPAMLRDHYANVPLASAAWIIGSFKAPDGKGPILPLPGGVDFTLPAGTVTVTSVGLPLNGGTGIEFKLQAITHSEQDAHALAETTGTFMQIFRTASTNTGGGDPDVKAFFESIQISQEGTSTNFAAQAPVGFLKKIVSGK